MRIKDDLYYEDDRGYPTRFKPKRAQNKACHGCKHYELDKYFPERCISCKRMMNITELGDKYELL